MKTLIFKNAILFLSIDPDTDTANCYFLFFISWNCFKMHEHTFAFKDITMAGIKQFYKTLANDWTKTYKL